MTAATAGALGPGTTGSRPRLLMIGTGLAVAAGSVFFGALLAIYMTMRHDAGGTTAAWVPDGVTFDNAALTFSTVVTLGLAGLTVQWAVRANSRHDHRAAASSMGLTLLFGAAHINMVSAAVSDLGVGVGQAWSNLVFPITIASLVTTAIAMAFVTVAAFKALGGQTGRSNPSVAASALFWHFSTAAWFAVFIAIYGVK